MLTVISYAVIHGIQHIECCPHPTTQHGNTFFFEIQPNLEKQPVTAACYCINMLHRRANNITQRTHLK